MTSQMSAGQPTCMRPQVQVGSREGGCSRGAGRGFLRGGMFADLLPVGMERRGRWQKLPRQGLVKMKEARGREALGMTQAWCWELR